MSWKSKYQEAFGRIPYHYGEEELISNVLKDLNITYNSVTRSLIKYSIKYFSEENNNLKNHSFSKAYFGNFYIKTTISFIKDALYEKVGFIYPDDFKNDISKKINIFLRKQKLNRICVK